MGWVSRLKNSRLLFISIFVFGILSSAKGYSASSEHVVAGAHCARAVAEAPLKVKIFGRLTQEGRLLHALKKGQGEHSNTFPEALIKLLSSKKPEDVQKAREYFPALADQLLYRSLNQQDRVLNFNIFNWEFYKMLKQLPEEHHEEFLVHLGNQINSLIDAHQIENTWFYDQIKGDLLGSTRDLYRREPHAMARFLSILAERDQSLRHKIFSRDLADLRFEELFIEGETPVHHYVFQNILEPVRKNGKKLSQVLREAVESKSNLAQNASIMSTLGKELTTLADYGVIPKDWLEQQCRADPEVREVLLSILSRGYWHAGSLYENIGYFPRDVLTSIFGDRKIHQYDIEDGVLKRASEDNEGDALIEAHLPRATLKPLDRVDLLDVQPDTSEIPLKVLHARPEIKMTNGSSLLFYSGPELNLQRDGIVFYYNREAGMGAIYAADGSSHNALKGLLGAEQKEMGGIRISGGETLVSRDLGLDLRNFQAYFHVSR